MTHLFEPFPTRSLTLRNRLCVSPMCQYSSVDGFADDWHLVHLGARAIGGAGLVMTEATAVEARGRISDRDLGLWKDEHVSALRPIAQFLKRSGAVPAIQLAHAGRKGSRTCPWLGDRPLLPSEGAWFTVAPSAVAFAQGDPLPHALSEAEIHEIVQAFARAAERARAAEFEVLEIHAAHGYLLHEFLSPLSNFRADRYGGSLEGRARFLLETVQAVRGIWPEDLPVWVRLSCTDWVEGGFTSEDSVALARMLRAVGVDLIDCSSGGSVPRAQIPVGPGYQVGLAEAIRQNAQVATGAVGMITEAHQADAIIREGKADVVLIAREMLRDPNFALHAAHTLGQVSESLVPVQYSRAFPRV